MRSFFNPRNYLVLFCFLLALSSCKDNTAKPEQAFKAEGEKEGGDEKMDNIRLRMEYEFNMLKNPTTGLIPEGVREAELAQAREILAAQQASGRIEAVNAYTFQGPNNLGGRTRAIAYDVRFNGAGNQVIIAGGVSGGVYKSTDNGATWVRKSPTGQHFSCTSIAQDTRAGQQDTWYYSVGEASGNSAGATGAFYCGNGVYKSVDNGETWTRLTNSNTSALETFTTAEDVINKVVVDPTNGNVYAACAATIRRSTDGGATWATVLNGTLANSAQYTDLVVTTTGRFYAGFGGTNSVGSDGVWTSTTGASGSWTRIAGPAGTPAGWPTQNTYGRVTLAIAPSNQAIIYVLLWNGTTYSCAGPAPEAMFFRLDMTVPATPAWTNRSANLPDEAGCLSGNDPFAVQTGYDLVVGVKPDNENVVFIGGTNAYRSTDGFATTGNTTRIGGYASAANYALYANSHPDIHAFTFQPGSPSIMLCGNDGGIQRTTDVLAATVAWTQINTGYRTYQYYYVEIDPRLGNAKAIGGAQDNGTTRNIGGTGTDFELVTGGDGVSVGLSDLVSGTQYEYVGSQLGTLNRRTSGTALGFINAALTPAGESGTGLFVTLFKLDQDNTSERLYYANDNALYRSTAASTMTSAGWTSMTGVATAVGASNDITALATTRGAYAAGTSSLFFGTSNGQVFRLDDPTGVAAATAPVNITGTINAGYISSIAVNPRNDDTVMVTLSNYGIVGVYWTGNANSATPTWTAVEGSLTLPSYRSCAIYAVPNSPEVQYYAGTSAGLYRAIGLPNGTFPATPGWIQESPTGIGNAPVVSLSLRPSDGNLLVGTHGYGMWKTQLALSVLPTVLTEFKGTIQPNKSALLQWTTSSEYNSKNFELQKSLDGVTYRTIATIPAAGSSSSTLNYSYNDREPLTEKNYYRLKSVDIDNSSRLSDIVLLKLAGAAQELQVLGNPFKNTIDVRFVKTPAGKPELKLTDMSGRVVARQVFGTGQQQIRFSIPPAALSNGTYILQASVDGQVYTTKLLRQ
jgi:hypothetical protein